MMSLVYELTPTGLLSALGNYWLGCGLSTLRSRVVSDCVSVLLCLSPRLSLGSVLCGAQTPGRLPISGSVAVFP